MEYMIFHLIDKTKEKALLSLVEEKGLTKKDIILILQTLELNRNVSVDVLNIEKVLNHFEISEDDGEHLSIFDSAKIERIGAAVAFDLSKKKGRAIIDYDPAYPFAILRICTN